MSGLDTLLGDNSQTWSLTTVIPAQVGDTQDKVKEALEEPELITQTALGVFVNMQALQKVDRNKFYEFVNQTFASGKYFPNINYKLFSSLLYDKDYAPNGTTLEKLSWPIAPLNDERRWLYNNFKVISGRVDFLFDKTPFQKQSKENPISPMSLWELIGFLWQNNIRYGFLEEEILKAIAEKESQKITIALPLEPTPSEDARIVKISEKFIISRAPTESNGRLDYEHLKNSLSQTQKGEAIIKKVPAKKWVPGYNIDGTVIPPSDPKDKDLSVMCGEGVEMIQIDNEDTIVSKVTWFFQVDDRSKQIHVRPSYKFVGNISGAKTWSIDIIWGAFELIGNIDKWYDLNGTDITSTGIMAGRITSRWGSIFHKWSITWAYDRQNRFKNGTIINDEGDIKVEGKIIQNAFLQSKKWSVHLLWTQIIENSIIIGNSIIGKKFINCILIGGNIKVDSLEWGCKVYGKVINISQIRPSESWLNAEIWGITQGREQWLWELAKLKNTFDVVKSIYAKLSLNIDNPEDYIKVKNVLNSHLLKLEAAMVNKLTQEDVTAKHKTIKEMKAKLETYFKLREKNKGKSAQEIEKMYQDYFNKVLENVAWVCIELAKVEGALRVNQIDVSQDLVLADISLEDLEKAIAHGAKSIHPIVSYNESVNSLSYNSKQVK